MMEQQRLTWTLSVIFFIILISNISEAHIHSLHSFPPRLKAPKYQHIPPFAAPLSLHSKRIRPKDHYVNNINHIDNTFTDVDIDYQTLLNNFQKTINFDPVSVSKLSSLVHSSNFHLGHPIKSVENHDFYANQIPPPTPFDYRHRAVVLTSLHDEMLPAELKNPFYMNDRVRTALALASWFHNGESLVEHRDAEDIPRYEIYKLLSNAGLIHKKH